MTSSIADIVSALANALAPIAIIQFAGQFYVRSAQANAFTVNARKVRFPTDAGAVPGVQRVIPDIQFPNVRGVHGGDKVNGAHQFAVWSGYFMRDTDNEFVGADTAEGRHDIIRQFVGIDF